MSRDACQAPDAISLEKTIARRLGVRPFYSRTINSPPGMRVAEKSSPGNGVNSLPRLPRPFSAFSARVTHARNPFFAPETIARRRPVPPPPPRMDDTRDAMRASREEAARRGTRDGQGAHPLPAAPFSIPAQKNIAPLPARARSEWRRGARVTGAAARSSHPPTLFMRGRANGR